MIQIATFTRKFFIELVKQLQIYGTLYVTEDGNIYVNESQAQARCQSREKLAHLNGELVQELRYARVDKVNPPRDTAEFEEMLENQFRARRQAAKNSLAEAEKERNRPVMSDAEAEALLEKSAPEAKKQDEEAAELIEGVLYTEIRDAIRASVNPNLHHNAGYDKVLKAYDALTDEQKSQVAEQLAK
jgi:hypothetical protein